MCRTSPTYSRASGPGLPFNSHAARTSFPVKLALSEAKSVENWLFPSLDDARTRQIQTACEFYSRALQNAEQDAEVECRKLVQELFGTQSALGKWEEEMEYGPGDWWKSLIESPKEGASRVSQNFGDFGDEVFAEVAGLAQEWVSRFTVAIGTSGTVRHSKKVSDWVQIFQSVNPANLPFSRCCVVSGFGIRTPAAPVRGRFAATLPRSGLTSTRHGM